MNSTGSKIAHRGAGAPHQKEAKHRRARVVGAYLAAVVTLCCSVVWPADVRTVQSIREQVGKRGTERRVVIEGSVTTLQETSAASGFYVQDATGGLLVVGSGNVKVTPGELVRVRGRATLSNTSELQLEGESVESLGTGVAIKPKEINLAQARGNCCPGELVSVRGIVREVNIGFTEDSIQLRQSSLGTMRAQAVRTLRDRSPFSGIAVGSEVQLTGVVVPDRSGVSSGYQIRIRDASDLQVIPTASWIPPASAGLTLIGTLFLIALAAGVRIWTLRRTVDQKAQEIHEHEARYRQLFDSSPQPMWVVDRNTLRFLAVNETTVREYGFTRDEFLGMTLLSIRPHEEAEAFLASRNSSGQTPTAGPWKHLRKDGTIFEVELKSHRILFAGCDADLMLATDVTERKSLEDQLRQSQKMEAIGRLAGGIAHDFNNLLTVILGYSELLSLELAENPDMQGKVEEIRKAGDRAAGLTRQLLAFSRQQVMEQKTLSVHAVIENLATMLRRLLGEDVELHTVLKAQEAWIKADPTQMDQVLLNLAVNARDAMPEGGRLRLETLNSDVDPSFARVHAIQPGKYVTLIVSDTGYGMDRETRARIFDPFFTTKAKVGGTGLGLSIVYGIVQQSGGCIVVESEVGVGTTFRILLPCTEPETKPKEAAPEVARVKEGRGTILLVEDEDAVRNLTRGVLSNAGYKVFSASNGHEALMLFEHRGDGFHLLLTDVVMPEMSGPELAGRLQKIRHDLPVVFMSGYNDHAAFRRGSDSGMVLVEKPFSTQKLLSSIENALTKAGRAN